MELIISSLEDLDASTLDIDPDFNTVDEELFIDVHELTPSGG